MCRRNDLEGWCCLILFAAPLHQVDNLLRTRNDVQTQCSRGRHLGRGRRIGILVCRFTACVCERENQTESEKDQSMARVSHKPPDELCLKSNLRSRPRSGPNENSPTLQRWGRRDESLQVREADGSV